MNEVFMIIVLFGSQYVADLSGWTSSQRCVETRAYYEAVDVRHEIRCVTREQMAAEAALPDSDWK